MFPTTILRSPGFVDKVLKSFHTAGGFDAHTLSGLRIVNSQPGHVQAEFTVEKKHLNRIQSLHGGLIATAVDIGGSLAIASHGMFATGVSTDINVSYISGAKEGELITVDCKCDRLGRTLAFTSVELSTNGKQLALGRHTKFVAKIYDHPENEPNSSK